MKTTSVFAALTKTVCVAMAVLGAQAREAVKIDLAGEWNCAGMNFSGKVKLPGTLADAGLGEFQTPAHHAAYTERTSKTSLALKYKYHGVAVYSRTVTLTAEQAAKPLEVFLERVMWTSRLKIDGRIRLLRLARYAACPPHPRRRPRAR